MNLQKDILVENFDTFICQYFLPLISVYKFPLDYPDKFVARLFDMQKPTKYVIIKDTLEEIEIPYGLVKLPRSAEDINSLLHSWV